MAQRNAQPHLILLPGMVCNADSWAPVLGALTGHTSVTIASYPHHTSLKAMAESVLTTAPQRFALAGHSMGGRVAMEILRLAPERVEKLCLIATEHTAKPTGEAGLRETQARTGMIELARTQGMQAMAEQWAPNLVAPAHPEKERIVKDIVRMIASQSVTTLAAHIAAGETRPDSSAVLEQYTGNTLLIAGADDTLRPASVMAQMQPLLASSQFETLPVSGHMPMMEQPEAVSRLLAEWLAQPSIHPRTEEAVARHGAA